MSSMEPVSISYLDLLKQDLSPLHDDILQAFGSDAECLGLIVVRDLPKEFGELRNKGLRAAATFAQDLSHETREKYTDPESSYSFGWSHGKEIMNGKPDIYKGSYYANPLLDTPEASEQARLEHSSYLRSNIWPSEDDCPGFTEAVKALAKFMTDIALRLARACDHLVAAHSEVASIEKMIAGSQCSKARLLHYYPPERQNINVSNDIAEEQDGISEIRANTQQDSWCGDHLDHSLLTALCPAMYLFHPTSPLTKAADALSVPSPTSSTGLYIRTRAGKTVKASFPKDCMAFQTGEALEILTKGKLKATPHFVAAGSNGPIIPAVIQTVQRKIASDEAWTAVRSGTISRETMAVFLQPNHDEVIGEDGETFGQFSKRILGEHYESKD